ncbi:hypothetical protein [Lihuaxuella thermophila]|uniref:Uncharacterized protein n=1 Tax=Lihuaxuella thermophila TaxID=1173111 RepID=A0A1H8HC97_9BACL|nr:hypothetical protein [Lihuaxuella thermophila]SEN53599.1 hypothetical protein SAMN05444955_113134 [Lihuaxuella thermophila]SEN77988.1 hypothetical protein SAMN05444955_12325 [Lihuaxuella thermophila]SEN80587.1 hypothetical protein SAMN05444955_12617 [Lihuaxuella thermophila]
MNITICATCGKQFEYLRKKGPARKYCSDECRNKQPRTVKNMTAENMTAVCVVCNAEFAPRYKSQKCCSRECGKKSAGQVLSQRFQTHICKHCGSEFKHKRSGRTKNIFCSRECAYNHRKGSTTSNKRKEYKDLLEEPKKNCGTKPYVEKKCRHCGTLFRTNYMAERRVYCSIKCSNRANALNRQKRLKGKFVERVFFNGYIRKRRRYMPNM